MAARKASDMCKPEQQRGNNEPTYIPYSSMLSFVISELNLKAPASLFTVQVEHPVLSTLESPFGTHVGDRC